MEHPVPAKHKNGVSHILHLPGGQRIIACSWDGPFRVWDLERGTQVEEWEDKDEGVYAIALSPGGKTVASGKLGGAVKLSDVDTGKVIKTLTGPPTHLVQSVCWRPDGERVVSGYNETFARPESSCGVFRVWDVESGETIIGPIKAGEYVFAVCYSPDGRMITTSGNTAGLKIWDANSGESRCRG